MNYPAATFVRKMTAVRQRFSKTTLSCTIICSTQPQTCCKLSISPDCYCTTCWQFATDLLISSSCNKPFKIKLIATCHLYRLVTTCCKNLQQACGQQGLAINLQQTCNRLVVNKLPQTMRTHPDIGLL